MPYFSRLHIPHQVEIDLDLSPFCISNTIKYAVSSNDNREAIEHTVEDQSL
jgi:hypothetical protein